MMDCFFLSIKMRECVELYCEHFMNIVYSIFTNGFVLLLHFIMYCLIRYVVSRWSTYLALMTTANYMRESANNRPIFCP